MSEELTELTLTFKLEEVQYIQQVMGTRPYNEVAALQQKIRDQAKAAKEAHDAEPE
jgi:hypothetical protein